jgi:hypothetical protein
MLNRFDRLYASLGLNSGLQRSGMLRSQTGLGGMRLFVSLPYLLWFSFE